MDVEKGLGIVKDLDEIIAAAASEYGDGHIGVTRRAYSHLVEGAVTAAGVDAVFLTGLGGLQSQPGAVAGALGQGNAVIQIPGMAGGVDLGLITLELIPAARRRIDDEQMLHRESLVFSLSIPL